MAITWGAWEYSGGNGMRVGIEVVTTSVSHTSTSVRFTADIYTENQYSYNDSQTLSYGGAIGGSTNFTNNAGGSVVFRATKTYTYNYGSTEYGSSPGSRTFTAALSGAYNGVTPSVSVSRAIPARPYDNPATPTSVSATRVSDSSSTVNWTNHPTAGEPYDSVWISDWNNVTNAWDSERQVGGDLESASEGATVNRRYRFRVRARNSAGWSGLGYSNFLQTTPAAPSGCAVEKSGTTSLVVSWSNGASTLNGYAYDTLLEEQVDGGAWTQIVTIAAGTASYERTGRSAGSVYSYRVRARSTVGATTYSGYSTSGSIQLQAPPAAPTGFTVTYGSDTSSSLAWTNNPTTDAPYDSLTVQRWRESTGAWETLATLSGTTTSLTDSNMVANEKYQWRIRSNNAAGSSVWVTSDYVHTTPAAPSNAKGKLASPDSITVTWANNVGYSTYNVNIEVKQDAGAWTALPNQPSGTASYTYNGLNATSTYRFRVRAASGGATVRVSAWVETASVAAATVPAAPTNLSIPVTVFDGARVSPAFSWQHNPGLDAADQTKFQIQYREVGTATWTVMTEVASATSSTTLAASTFVNGKNYEWQVRTKGVHATASPWSASHTFNTSTTPTVTLMEPSSSTATTSQVNVSWSYGDAEATPQAAWIVQLFDAESNLLEEQTEYDTTSATAIGYQLVDGASYTLKLRVLDGDGIWSDWVVFPIDALFTPPAEVLLAADLDDASGAVILSLSPTADDGGATTLPASAVTIERQILDPELEAYGEWEVVAERVAPDATIIDPTAPINEDGHYRVTTYSNAPSSYRPAHTVIPSKWDNQWLYVSGGPNFDVVCRMYANIQTDWKVSRSKTLHNFAGRARPVLYSGESVSRTLAVTGLTGKATGDGASTMPEWTRLAKQKGPVLLRAPGHRIYGMLSEVGIKRIYNGLHEVTFNVTEVWR